MDESEVEQRVAARIEEVLAKQAAVLKARYREQALKAVAEAEAKGAQKQERLQGVVATLQEQVQSLSANLQASQQEASGLSESLKLAISSAKAAPVPVPAPAPVVAQEPTVQTVTVDASREQLEAAFEKGKSHGSRAIEALKVAEDEAKRYKAVLKMMQANDKPPSLSSSSGETGAGDDENNGSPLLVKYVMENVFRETKKEFSQGSTDRAQAVEEQVVSRMREVLTTAAAQLTGKLGALALVRKDKMSDLMKQVAHLEGQVQQQVQHMHGMQQELQKAQQQPSQRKASSIISNKSDGLPPIMRRAHILYITSRAQPIRCFIHVFIDKYAPVKVKAGGLLGAFKWEEVIMYSIQSTTIARQRAQSSKVLTPFDMQDVRHAKQERRYKEFKALYTALRKEYPHLMIPHVPDCEMMSTSNAPLNEWHYRRTRNDKSEWVSSSGSPSKPGEDGGDGNGSVKLETRRRLLTLWLQFLCHHSVLQQSATLAAFIQGSTVPSGPYIRALDARRAMLLLSPAPVHEQEQQHGLNSLDYALELGLKDLSILKKDVRVLDNSLMDLIETVRELAEHASARAKVEWKFADIIGEHVLLEKNRANAQGVAFLYGTDTLFWQVVGGVMSNMASAAPPMYQLLQHFLFLRQVNTVATNAIDHNMAAVSKRNGSTSPMTVNPRMNIRSGSYTGYSGAVGAFARSLPTSTDGSVPTKSIAFPDEEEETDDGHERSACLALAVGTAEDWDGCRRLRTVQTMTALHETAAKMKQMHSEALAWWQQARLDLENIELNSAQHPDPRINNRKASRDLLVQDCRTLGAWHKATKSEFHKKRQLQGEFVGVRSKLKGTFEETNDTGTNGPSGGDRDRAPSVDPLGNLEGDNFAAVDPETHYRRPPSTATSPRMVPSAPGMYVEETLTPQMLHRAAQAVAASYAPAPAASYTRVQHLSNNSPPLPHPTHAPNRVPHHPADLPEVPVDAYTNALLNRPLVPPSARRDKTLQHKPMPPLRRNFQEDVQEGRTTLTSRGSGGGGGGGGGGGRRRCCAEQRRQLLPRMRLLLRRHTHAYNTCLITRRHCHTRHTRQIACRITQLTCPRCQ